MVSFYCLRSCFIHAQLFVTLWIVAHQTPLSMGFSRQGYWSGLPGPPPGDLPDPGTDPGSLMAPTLAGRFSTTSATWEAHFILITSLKALSRNTVAFWGAGGSNFNKWIWGEHSSVHHIGKYATLDLSAYRSRKCGSSLQYFPIQDLDYSHGNARRPRRRCLSLQQCLHILSHIQNRSQLLLLLVHISIILLTFIFGYAGSSLKHGLLSICGKRGLLCSWTAVTSLVEHGL